MFSVHAWFYVHHGIYVYFHQVWIDEKALSKSEPRPTSSLDTSSRTKYLFSYPCGTRLFKSSLFKYLFNVETLITHLLYFADIPNIFELARKVVAQQFV